MTERVYAMVRVRAGVYLLPSNDGKTLYRLSSYVEDGSAKVDDGRGGWRPVVGTFWEVARNRVPLPDIAPHMIAGADDEQAWLWNRDLWLEVESSLDRRADAIEEALKR